MLPIVTIVPTSHRFHSAPTCHQQRDRRNWSGLAKGGTKYALTSAAKNEADSNNNNNNTVISIALFTDRPGALTTSDVCSTK